MFMPWNINDIMLFAKLHSEVFKLPSKCIFLEWVGAGMSYSYLSDLETWIVSFYSPQKCHCKNKFTTVSYYCYVGAWMIQWYKLIFCFSLYCFKLGLAPQIEDLYGKVTFTGMHFILVQCIAEGICNTTVVLSVHPSVCRTLTLWIT